LRQHDNSFFGDPILFRLASGLSVPILPELAELGAYTASDEVETRARFITRHPPLLHLYDNHGARCEEIDLHPAYHSLLTRARHAGIASSLFESDHEEARLCHQTRMMRLFLLSGVECATLQELCLASAALDLIHIDNALCSEWKSLLVNRIHDPLPRPYPSKQSASLSFAIHDFTPAQPMQALSINEPHKDSSAIARLYGQKNAVINPLADGFLVKASFEGKPSLFLVPRLLADGSLNGIRASQALETTYSCADLHFHASAGWFLGPTGMADILLRRAQMQIQSDVNVMRVGMMRRALRLAVDRLRHDEVRGQLPERVAIQTRILADAALDCAAATLLVLRIAQAFDQGADNPQEAVLARLASSLIGAWTARIAPQIFDCAFPDNIASNVGRSKYHEGNFAARMQQALLMNCGFGKTPLQLLADCVEIMHEHKTIIDTIIADLSAESQEGALLRTAMQMTYADPSLVCLFTEQFAYMLAAFLMQGLDMEIVTSAFVNSRLSGRWRASYGMLDVGFNPTFILETLYPSG